MEYPANDLKPHERYKVAVPRLTDAPLGDGMQDLENDRCEW
jgi:hypothetical protein